MSSNPCRILIVEDNPIDVEAAKRALANAKTNYKILTADRLGRACEILDETSVDVVVLDLGLPDGAGIECVQAVRKITDAPIVILTAWDEVFTAKIMDAGANEYLSKSDFDEGGLEEVIHQALNAASTHSNVRPAGSSDSSHDTPAKSNRLNGESDLLELATQLRLHCSDLTLNHPELRDLDEVKAISHIAKQVYEKLQ